MNNKILFLLAFFTLYHFTSYAQLPDCSTTDCNLVCNTDFEESNCGTDYSLFTMADHAFDPVDSSPDIVFFDPVSSQMWMNAFCGSLYSQYPSFGACPDVPFPFPYNYPTNPDNLQFISVSSATFNGGNPVLEGISYPLDMPMEQDKSYILSFWARPHSLDCPVQITVVGDDLPACPLGEITTLDPPGSVSSCGFTSNLLDDDFPMTISGDWQEYVVELDNLPEDISFMIIYLNSPGAKALHTVYLDDIIVREKAPFSLDITASNNTPCTFDDVNLNVEVCFDASQDPTGNGNPFSISLVGEHPDEYEAIGNNFIEIGVNELNPSNNYCMEYSFSYTPQNGNIIAGVPFAFQVNVESLEPYCDFETVEVVPIDCVEGCPLCPSGIPLESLNTGTNYSSDYFPIPFPHIEEYRCIYVPPFSKLIINQDVNFSQCQFIMDEGAEIEIAPNMELTLSNSTLRGCTNMWKGISPKENSSLVMRITTIGDAQYGIDMKEFAHISVSASIFDQNYIGINVLTSVNNHQVRGNQFICSDDLLEPFSAQDPIPGTKTFAGIFLQNVPEFTVGVKPPPIFNPIPLSTFNIFDGIKNGIISRHSNLTCYNNEFRNIIKVDANSGVSILSNTTSPSSSLRVLESNNFSNGMTGIISRDDAKIDNVLMENMETGIDALHDINNSEVSITNNILTNCNIIGIDVSSYLPSVPYLAQRLLLIENNTVDVNNTNSAGHYAIQIREFLPSIVTGVPMDPKAKKILNNTISIANTQHGIKVLGSDFLMTGQAGELTFGGVLIEENTITTENQALADGTAAIFLGGTTGAQIRTNTIIGNHTSGEVFGIHLINSAKTAFCCNDISDTGGGITDGVRIEGQSESQGLFKQTTFGSPGSGLRMLPGAILGEQNNSGNRWTSSSGFAQHDGTPEEIFQSRFFAQSNSQFEPSSVFPLNGWFFNSAEVAPLCASLAGCGIPTLMLVEPPNTIKVQLANGTTETSVFSKSIQWENAQSLYGQLKADSDLLNKSTDLLNFYNTSVSGNIGGYYEVNQSLTGLFQVNNSNANTIGTYQILLEQKLNQIHDNNQLLIDATPSEQTVLIAEKTVLLNELKDVIADAEQLEASLKTQRYQEVDNVILENQALSAVEIFETNEKTVNDIFLKTIAKDNFLLTTTEQSTLLAIANQCPVEGGNAVFNARALLNALLDQPFLFSNADCYSISGKRIGSEKKEKLPIVGKYHIFPNPTDEMFSIEFIEGRKGNRIELYDLFGKMVLSKSIQQEETIQEINVEHIAEGVYICRIYDAKLEVFTSKLIILE